MQHIKRILAAAALTLTLLAASGCAEQEAKLPDEAKERITAVREECKTLDSGSYIVNDAITGSEEMRFDFCYSEGGALSYVFLNSDGSAEYHTGRQLNIRSADGEITRITPQDNGWHGYTKDSPHPYAEGGFFSFFDNGIESTAVEQTDNGVRYRCMYNAARMSKETGTQGLTAFSLEYFFDNDGSVELIQRSTVETDGVAEDYAYSIRLTDKNAVTPQRLSELFADGQTE